LRVLGLTLALALTLLAGTAAAQTSHPREVETVLDAARTACREAEGGKVTFRPEVVRRLDLTRDGRADYIVDLNEAECTDAATLFCGTGGCDLTILVGQPDGAFKKVFEGRALRYEMLPGKGAKRIKFRLHGSYCGKGGTERCEQVRKIDGKKFEFRQPT
jgi:hypothetical protein